MELQMVQNGDHKCSRKSESHVEEEKTIPEVSDKSSFLSVDVILQMLWLLN